MEKRNWFGLTTGATAAGLFLLVIASSQLDQPVQDLSVKFAGEGPILVEPIERNLPDIDFVATGEYLQLGVFNRLQGAESRQSELTRMGFNPYIEKRVTNDQPLYAVLIGPLKPTSYKAVTQKLDTNQTRYFHVRTGG